ncbi:hypothetical protein [Myceligenerans indicum]|uniref:Uncharacterized protein n=1 Tax=Myceligenerans indicum TaxID=2593663 RepID=A0ABS1LHY5_9MICO|nr:hypothetical protein [Myceligenerans indicum]MBL0885438.1 hypothetical protein [Myceligenerans indicum]
MTDTNGQARVLGRGIRVIVPGSWVNIPLKSREAAQKFIKKLVRDQVGTDDRLASMRRDAVQELLNNVGDAVAVGVHTYLLSLEMLPGVPFPAAMVMVDEEWPAAAREHRDAGDTGAALRASFPEGEVAVQRLGPVAREVEMAEKVLEDGEQRTESLTMRLSYHVPYPDRSKLLLVRVNVPNVPSAEPFAMLFDEIVDTITFLENDGGSAPGEDTAGSSSPVVAQAV